MWKEILKRYVPALRHRPTVLRLHALVDRIKGLPALTRAKISGKKVPRTVNVPNRERRVVFVSEMPLRREPKFAFALKRAGWDVILVQGARSKLADFSDYAEVQTFSSSREAVELVGKSGACVAHHFSPSFDSVSLRLVENKPTRIIVDFYDYFYGMADGKPHLEEKFALDIEKQRYCYEHADAVCSPDLQIQYNRKVTRLARGKPVICFPNYCWDQFPLPERRQSDEIHIVQIGFMEFEARSGEDVGTFRVVQALVAAGCHFHIYLHPNYPAIGTMGFNDLFRDYLSLQKEGGRVHFHATVPTRELTQALTQYDFGLNMMNGPTFGIPLEHHNSKLLTLLASARQFDYLDAGLPTLCDGVLSFNRHLFGPFGAFLDGTRLIREMRIREALSKRPSREQILKARAALGVERHIRRLARFYESLA
jgi:hypothetical protein